jgi:hypothetical protein
MENQEQQNSGFFPTIPNLIPIIRIGKMGVITIHQISEEELTRLVRGSKHAIFLTVGIAALSISLSLLFSLLTTMIESDRLFCVFVIITAVSFVFAVTFMILWWLYRRDIEELVSEIRSRINPEQKQHKHYN